MQSNETDDGRVTPGEMRGALDEMLSSVDTFVGIIRLAVETLENYEGSRELSLAKTKLDEFQMWMCRAIEEMSGRVGDGE